MTTHHAACLSCLRQTAVLAVALFALTPGRATAAEPQDGFLCCNLQVDDGWISDLNLHVEGKPVLPAGTPVTVLGHGRQRVKLMVDGREVALGNDYSRQLDLASFQQRYVVAADPRERLQGASADVQAMVAARQVARGMDRQQVLMSLGYPVALYTTDLSQKRWTYFFRNEEQRFWVVFDDAGRVESVSGDATALAAVSPAVAGSSSAAAGSAEPPCPVNVYRPSIKHWNTNREKATIYLDDAAVGSLSPGESLCLSPAPGSHRLSYRNTHMLIPSLIKGPEVDFELQPDRPVFFRYEKYMGGVVVTGVGVTPTSRTDFVAATEVMWRSRD